jgi:DNA-binding transcriptional LysR family regulator
MNKLNVRCFTSIARTKSFTKTAKELSISQQAVSQNIQRLEEELNVALLNRSGKLEYLTPAGNAFLEWVQGVGHSLERGAGLYSNADGRTAVSVGFSELIGMPQELAEIIHSFCQEYPEVNLKLFSGSVSQMVSDLQEQTLDLCVLPGHCETYLSDMAVNPLLMEIPLYLVMDSHLRRMIQDSHLPVFPYLDLLTVNQGERTEEQTVSVVRSLCVRQGLPISNVRVLPNVDTLYGELLNGNGYAFVPMHPMLEARQDVLCFQKVGINSHLIFASSLHGQKLQVNLFTDYVKNAIVQAKGGKLHEQRRDRMLP